MFKKKKKNTEIKYDYEKYYKAKGYWGADRPGTNIFDKYPKMICSDIKQHVIYLKYMFNKIQFQISTTDEEGIQNFDFELSLRDLEQFKNILEIISNESEFNPQGMVLAGFDFYLSEFVRKSCTFYSDGAAIGVDWIDYTQQEPKIITQKFSQNIITQLLDVITQYIKETTEISDAMEIWKSSEPQLWWFPLEEQNE